jgi:hypothetical protein
MSPTEIEAIQAVDTALNSLDPAARSRVLKWAYQKYSSTSEMTEQTDDQIVGKKKHKKSQPHIKGKKKAIKGKTRPTIVKDLNLRPKGKKDFRSFVEEKKPDNNYEKCTVAVYYLKQELGISQVTMDHVLTCYKAINWRQPSNYQNALALTAHRMGWLDTSDIADIKLTAHGENLVEQDLPRKDDKSK